MSMGKQKKTREALPLLLLLLLRLLPEREGARRRHRLRQPSSRKKEKKREGERAFFRLLQEASLRRWKVIFPFSFSFRPHPSL